METVDYEKKKERKEKEVKQPRPKPKAKKNHWVFLILIILAVGLLPFTAFRNTNEPAPETQVQPEQTPQENVTEPQVAYYQKIIALIKYDKEVCPDLKIEHTNTATDIVEVLDIEQVKDIEQEINFVELGRYDTNNPNIKPLLNFVNEETCQPQVLLISNTQFINLLLEYGVEVEK